MLGGHEQAWRESQGFCHAPDSTEDPRNRRVFEGLPPRGFLPDPFDAPERAVLSVPRSDPSYPGASPSERAARPRHRGDGLGAEALEQMADRPRRDRTDEPGQVAAADAGRPRAGRP